MEASEQLMTHNLCPDCDSPMIVTDHHARGYNTTGAAGGRTEPVHGFVVRARCRNSACGADWERGDYDDGWRRSR